MKTSKAVVSVAAMLSIAGGAARLPAQPAEHDGRFPAETLEKWNEYGALTRTLQATVKTWRVYDGGKVSGDPDELYQIKRNATGTLLLARIEAGSLNRSWGVNESYAFELRRNRSAGGWFASAIYLDPTAADAVSFIDQYLRGDPENVGVRHCGPLELYKVMADELVKSPGFEAKSVTTVKTGNSSVLRVEFTCEPPGDPADEYFSDGWFVVDPERYWVVCEFAGNVIWGRGAHTSLVHGTREFGTTKAGLPILVTSKVNIKSMGRDRPTERDEISKYEVEDRDPSAAEFSLSAFGLPEPVGMPDMNAKRAPWYLIIAAIGFVSLGIGLALGKHRRYLRA